MMMGLNFWEYLYRVVCPPQFGMLAKISTVWTIQVHKLRAMYLDRLIDMPDAAGLTFGWRLIMAHTRIDHPPADQLDPLLLLEIVLSIAVFKDIKISRSKDRFSLAAAERGAPSEYQGGLSDSATKWRHSKHRSGRSQKAKRITHKFYSNRIPSAYRGSFWERNRAPNEN